MKNVLGTESNFRALSLRDLLEARDAYHYHLMNKPNVVGTAVGLYLIRKADPPPAPRGRELKPRVGPKTERTLGNSEVRDYSWPCVLVFVDTWIHESDIRSMTGRCIPKRSFRRRCTYPTVEWFQSASSKSTRRVQTNKYSFRIGIGPRRFSRQVCQSSLTLKAPSTERPSVVWLLMVTRCTH